MSENSREMHQDITPKVYVVGPASPEKDEINNFVDACGLKPVSQAETACWMDGCAPFLEDVLDAIFKHVNIVIFLLVGEDNVCLRNDFGQRNDEYTWKRSWQQSAPDRIFEAGYAFRRYRNRIILVRYGQAQVLSDVTGRFIYVFDRPEDRNALEYLLKQKMAMPLSNVGEKEQNSMFQVGGVAMEGRSGEKPDPKKVFVVFGRNTFILNEVRAFLGVIGLSPITWGDAMAYSRLVAGPTGKVVEAAFNQAWAIVVLLTGDDLILPESRTVEELHSTENLLPASQPRANVLFEAGMAFGDRRLADKTILVDFDFDTLRTGSHISSQQRLRLNNSLNRREEFIRRLRTAGCAVDLQDERWYRTGNFHFAYKG